MTEEGVNQLPVIDHDRLLGMIGRDALMGYLRMRAEMGI
jgi:predicted transcriptional regulator